jgi:uncharacterized membrane protein (GlpM family)
MSEIIKYGVYFLIGGLVVSLSTYLGTKGEGFFAALASTFPAITGVTFVLIYLNGGYDATLIYAKNLLWFVPPWLAYVGFMIVALTHLGFWTTMAGSLVIYMGCVGLLRLALR